MTAPLASTSNPHCDHNADAPPLRLDPASRQEPETPGHLTQRTLQRTVELAQDFLFGERHEPVAPPLPPDELARQIDLAIRDDGLTIDAVFEMLAQVMHATPRTGSRAFFNQLFAGRDAIPTAAEILSVIMNTSMYTYRIAGPHALIEREVIGHMARKVGYTDGEGTFCAGGSLSNLCAMVLARNHAAPDFASVGADGTRLTAYMSEDAHYSLPKSAAVTGIGRDNLRSIPTDDRGRMQPDALRSAIDADRRAGHQPFMLIATAGTTVLGAFDPINELADIAHQHNLWFHIDGALGGSFLLSNDHRHLLTGCQRSDSFNWNPHKLMGVPLTCSALLVRQSGLLARNFRETADYLFQSGDDDHDPGTMSIQCGRRNDALKLWAAWKFHGDSGYARRTARLFDLIDHATTIVRNDPRFVLTAQPESVTLCFEVANCASEQICNQLLQQQRAMVGYADVNGRRVIRLACANPELTHTDIDEFFNHVRLVVDDLSR